jgi:hypothetical protein
VHSSVSNISDTCLLIFIIPKLFQITMLLKPVCLKISPFIGRKERGCRNLKDKNWPRLQNRKLGCQLSSPFGSVVHPQKAH